MVRVFNYGFLGAVDPLYQLVPGMTGTPGGLRAVILKCITGRPKKAKT